jgi:PPOX class probable F420-dependent enzyme
MNQICSNFYCTLIISKEGCLVQVCRSSVVGTQGFAGAKLLTLFMVNYNNFLLLILLMSEMTKDEIRTFLLQGTFTGKLGTINKNGTAHVVPIWYTVDEDDNIIFNTGDNSAKAKNIRRDNRVRLCVDDQTPLFSFVTIDGIAEIIISDPSKVCKWAKIIASRYMGYNRAEEYGRRNSSEGELLIKIKPTKVIGEKDIAGW